MTVETRMKLAEHYLSLDEAGKKRQHNLAKYVPEHEASKEEVEEELRL